MQPVNIEKQDDATLRIDWSDGHQSLYDIRYLRRNCPCANCNEIRRKKPAPAAGRLQILGEGEDLPASLTIHQAHVVGRYALSFVWSDGHQQGIYDFAYLRELCQCEQCQSARRNDATVHDQQ